MTEFKVIQPVTHLFVTLEHHALESVGASIARDVAEDFQIAAVVRHIENPVNGMLHEFNLAQVSGPVL